MYIANDRSSIINMSHVYAQSRREPEEVFQWETRQGDIITVHGELIRIAGLILFILNEKSN